MMPRFPVIVAGGLLTLLCAFNANAREAYPVMPVWDNAELQETGDGTYTLGNIRIDKGRRQFTVPAKVLRTEPPLEYFAVTRGGYKAYESLLEFWTSAFQLNLASILIGLEVPETPKPGYQFDKVLLEGQAVSIDIWWKDGESEREVQGLNALQLSEKPADMGQWIYTGSFQNSPDGPLAAEQSGTLIGFVHDPVSLFEHNEGLGIGAYGSVGGNTEVLPEVGEWVYVTISLAERSEGDQEARN